MVEKILRRCLQGGRPETDAELEVLLRAAGAEREAVFAAARAVRGHHFGNRIFLYGFVYFSTYCRNNCNFCYFRHANREPERYRKTAEEVTQTAVRLQQSGVHLIDLTMGEDPYFSAHPDRLAEMVNQVKLATELPIMVSPGVVSEECIQMLADAGADWYALYQETHNETLFAQLRPDQAYETRMACKQAAQEAGMLLEEGLLTDVGETIADRIHSFREMERIGAMQVRTMTFVPQSGTPMMGKARDSHADELLNIAVMRLLYPEKLIPASLDVDGLQGLAARLMAGANVVTSIIPPKEGYAGVAHATQDIDEGYRTVAGIQDTLRNCGLQPATAAEYQTWLRRHQAYATVGCGV